ncbi:hypothetical protein FHR32_000274 [Streptosporangium album]|uniref:Spore-associated protein A n=1 Tax=Streptosporangium album TaxID=47479 RepID=A0A7W7W7E9_9ACTN|nr:hypothetical protein [Streptosporangium album]MBB4935969.1 hypothetical protein [Streptosporangium album]
MGKVRRTAALALGMAATLAGSVALSSPAMAASSPVEACGGGSYHVIDQAGLGKYATVYLLYNGSTNCVVTWKKAPYAGGTMRISGYLEVPAINKIDSDAGNYRYYAGPVKFSAAGKCIRWGGSYGLSDPFITYHSPLGHCG